MPLVDVACSKCGHTHEVLIRMGEKPVCPTCGSQEVDQKIGVPAIGRGNGLPLTRESCPPPSAPPCGPGCCRL